MRKKKKERNEGGRKGKKREKEGKGEGKKEDKWTRRSRDRHIDG